MPVEEIFTQQAELGKQIENNFRNFRKDSKDRKIKERYFEKRLEQLEEIYSAFTANHNAVLSEADTSNSTYFKANYHDQITAVYKQFKQELEHESREFNETDSRASTASETFEKKDYDVDHQGPPIVSRESTSLDRLIREQTAQFSYIKRLVNKLQLIETPQTATYWEFQSSNVGIQWEKIMDLHRKIHGVCTSPEQLRKMDEEFYQIEDNVGPLMAQLMQNERNTKSELHSTTIIDESQRLNNTRAAPAVKLPKVQLPKFNGNYFEWMDFKNLFTEIIHKQAIGDSQRMWYLKTNLSGEALQLISHLTVSDSNYQVAWTELIDHYENTRLLVAAAADRLLNYPKIKDGSADEIKRFCTTIRESILNLKLLGESASDGIMMQILLKKLDSESHDRFMTQIENPRAIPKVDELLKFLQCRYQNLEHRGKLAQKSTFEQRKCTKTSTLAAESKPTIKCVVCKHSHMLFRCPKFKQMTLSQRWSTVKEKQLCSNCLRGGHFSNGCEFSGCPVDNCNKKHNSLLHQAREEKVDNKPSKVDSSDNPQRASLITQGMNNLEAYVFLATANINVQNNVSELTDCRAILDSCSQANFITESMCNQLGIKPFNHKMTIMGMGQHSTPTNKKVNIQIASQHNNFTKQIEAVVVKKIVGQQPSEFINKEDWPIPSNIQLADPAFHKPKKIDILLGAAVFPELMCNGQIRPGDHLPTLQNTLLGWVVIGALKAPSEPQSFCGITTVEQQISDQLQRFWKLEEIPAKTQSLSPEEKLCEQTFNETTTRTSTGRYLVKLPKATSAAELGASYPAALQRFLSLERKFKKQPKLAEEYTKFIKEYETLAHMEQVNLEDLPQTKYFLPHHAVLKETSTTTKLRVVFDASAKTTNNISLNDILLTGPTVQDDVGSLLLRFRFPKYAMSADIEKMYRQILVDDEDQFLQLILWRDSPNLPISIFKLKTVTYGTTSAPYLATKCLLKLAEDSADTYPEASKITKRDFYVDDLLTGTDDLQSAKRIQKQLLKMMKAGGFNIRKWCANHPGLLEDVPEEDREVQLNLNDKDSIKTLGLIWHPREDFFKLAAVTRTPSKITKRTILSEVGQIFDPLGLVNPTIVLGKIILQKLWQLGLDWDSALPQELHTMWESFRKQLCDLKEFQVARRVVSESYTDIQLHGFADASEAAYGAAIYVRSSNHDGHQVSLLCAKSKVAPLKKQTIARLELCAAKLLADLMKQVQDALHIKVDQIFYWSDSTVTLAWIKKPSSSLKTFVGNRVATINETSNPTQWHHIEGSKNPADIVSRGMMPADLIKSKLWFEGPEFLKNEEKQWPAYNTHPNADEVSKEIRSNALLTTVSDHFIHRINHRNSFKFLQNVVANILKFISCIRTTANTGRSIILTVNERENSLRVIIKFMQNEANLHREQEKALRSLSPFIDKDGILRVGGRIQASSLPYDAQHPYLLPKTYFTKMLMRDIHIQSLHAGPQALLCITRQKFWPLQGKRIASTIYRECIRCFKMKPRNIHQLMGNLPSSRINIHRTFDQTGVDFAGPFYVHYEIRGKRPTKVYLAVFVCFATKAVHLEVVSNLTTESFIGSLKRFISRRNRPSHIYSDNATNFVGAKADIEELREFFQRNQSEIMKATVDKDIQWSNIPPRSPHFGGLWEAAVKQAKRLLKSVINNTKLTYEQFTTVITEVEAVLNSRPITPMSNNPNDLEALTPAHFLIFSETRTLDEIDHRKTCKLPERWKAVSAIRHAFWDRWHTEYLQTLQQRSKWRTIQENVKNGALVIIKEQNTPPLNWPLGRIVNVIEGSDGLIRVADIKTQNGIRRRAIHQLCPLPIDGELQNEFHSREPSLAPTQEASKQNVIKTPKQTRKTTNRPVTRSFMKTACITTILLCQLLMPVLTSVSTPKLNITRLKNHPGIYFDGIGQMNIIDTEWHIISYINMSDFWNQANVLRTTLNKIELFSNQYESEILNSTIGELEHHLRDIESLNQFIKGNVHTQSPTRYKRGAINIIGNIANKLFGVLDDEYASNMERTLTQMKYNEEHNFNLVKNQTAIIEATANVMKRTTEELNAQFGQIASHLEGIEARIDMITGGISILQLINYLSLAILKYREMQLSIDDAITDIKHGKISPLLINPEQLQGQLHFIQNHLTKEHALPSIQGLDEMYSILQAVTTHSPSLIIFNIEVPVIRSSNFDLYRMLPFPTCTSGDCLFIKPSSEYLAIDQQTNDYSIFDERDRQTCQILQHNRFLCKTRHPIYDLTAKNRHCEVNMFFHIGNKITSCQYQQIPQGQIWVRTSKPNDWLFAIKEQQGVNIFCKNHQITSTIEGEGLLKIDPDCQIITEGVTLFGHQTNNHSSQLYVPSAVVPALNISITNLQYKTNSLRNKPLIFQNHNDYESILSSIRTIKEEESSTESYLTQLPDLHQSITYCLIVMVGIILLIAYCKKKERRLNRRREAEFYLSKDIQVIIDDPQGKA